MTVAVTMNGRAQKDFAGLSAGLQLRVRAKIEALAAYPNVQGIKALKGEWLGHYRVRVGDFRIIFTLGSGNITIVAIDDRKESY